MSLAVVGMKKEDVSKVVRIDVVEMRIDEGVFLHAYMRNRNRSIVGASDGAYYSSLSLKMRELNLQ